MSKQSLHRKKRSSGIVSPSALKGKLVEKVIKSMHEMPGVRVESNVLLPTLQNSSRKREIDVLLTGNLAGYPVRIAIECKNEKGPIDTPFIDSFIGKLQDIGIPPQCGIYVSASGYTSKGGGAIDRAKAAGVKLLELKGLTKDRLSASVREAFQTIVYLLLEITEISPKYIRAYIELNNRLYSSVPSVMWHEWITDQLPSLIGEYEKEVEIPIGESVGAIFYVKFKVLGLVATLSGRVEQFTLVNASDKQVEKSRANVTFDTSVSTIPVTTISTESQLKEFLKRPGVFHLIIERIKTPRIRCGVAYWPLSERVVNKSVELMQAFEAGKIQDLPPLDITEIEGIDLSTLWEPIWSGYSIAQKSKNGDNLDENHR